AGRDQALKSPLKVLQVAAELAPLLSTGGLAEVVNALPKALHDQGHDVRVALPCYRSIPESLRGKRIGACEAKLGPKRLGGTLRETRIPGTDIPVYLVEHPGYFGREHPYGHEGGEYGDNAERYCFFGLGLLDGLSRIGWKPDVINCHDWHTAPIVIFLKTRLANDPVWAGTPAVYTIHNLNFQGRFAADQLPFTGFDPALFRMECLEYFGDINLMKGAIVLADKLSTVSPRYAREIQTLEYGAGLDGVLRTRSDDLRGILNGIDYEVWNPARDPHIAAAFDHDDLGGKSLCKRDLQEAFHLPRRDAPLFGVVSRLTWQKGIDLIIDAAENLLDVDFQIALLGTGDAQIENRLIAAAQRRPGKVAVILRYDTAIAHKLFAGSDFFLMPSRYEPCGLSQLYSLAYGTVPIVRRTGGLADSVRNLSRVNGRGAKPTGLSFVPMTSQALLRAMHKAFDVYRAPKTLAALRVAGMEEDFSWARASRDYVALYREALAQAG
ncbi:MAG TPA: glycogen synthase GlgA, partial [Candidatus Hydrogenedentes bacterium]|nr:glycogen synthase GlgA [Candidatus Hydrogenedentota bacterium]